MSVFEYDVLIIGAGLAGLSAGAYLAGCKLRVALVAAGEPTACLSTGCIDFCAGLSALEGIAALPSLHPLHLVSMDDLRAAQDSLLHIMKEAALPYRGDISTNRRILTAIGSYKTTCLVPETMQACPANEKEAIHIVTFDGLKDFYPRFITARRDASFSVYSTGTTTGMGIAAGFEREDFLNDFLSWLDSRNIRENTIAFPALMGLDSSPRILKAIEEKTGRPVFEIPTLPPSIPGWRLFNALKNFFQRKGGDIYWNWPVTGVEKTGSVIEAVSTHSPGRSQSLNARAFILATGSFVGGGLYATRETIVEKVFDLPVFVPSAREEWFEDDYFSRNHAISRAGITVDKTFRPDRSPLTNVFACGGILAHAQILKYGCGNGLSWTTGYAAAKACEEMLQ